MGRSVCTRVAMTGVGGCLRAAKEDTRGSDPKEWAMTTWMARSGEDSCRRWPPNMHWPTRIQPAHVCEWFPCLVVPALNHHGRSPPGSSLSLHVRHLLFEFLRSLLLRAVQTPHNFSRLLNHGRLTTRPHSLMTIPTPFLLQIHGVSPHPPQLPRLSD